MVYCWLPFLLPAFAQTAEKTNDMDRIELWKTTLPLFGGEALNEAVQIRKSWTSSRNTFSVKCSAREILDIKTREMITCVCLATMQQLPQLKGHTGAALNVGVTPIELREAVYQCAPIIGFPKVLNAMTAVNEAFTERGIKVPLETQTTVTEENRYEKGHEIQYPLYGDRMKEALKDVPGGMGEKVARFLTEVHFGDFQTRSGLDTQTRELLTYCVLTVIGAEPQLHAHLRANLKAGNSKERVTAAVIQCMPYIGFPAALKALNIIKDFQPEN